MRIFSASWIFPVLHSCHEEVHSCRRALACDCVSGFRRASPPSPSPPSPSRCLSGCPIALRRGAPNCARRRLICLPRSGIDSERYSFPCGVTAVLSTFKLSCYSRAMKQFAVTAFLLILFAVPAFASHHVKTKKYPQAVHPQNPYLKHHQKKYKAPHVRPVKG